MSMRLRTIVGLTAAVTVVMTATASAATPRLRLNGIGPLTIGMTKSQALATGWIANQQLGCELASPRPRVLDFTGPNAPAGLQGSVSFQRGTLTDITIARGAITRTGVQPGVTTARRMIRAYRDAGFVVTSRFDPVFQARFTTAYRGGKTIVGLSLGSSRNRVLRSVSVPFVPLCE